MEHSKLRDMINYLQYGTKLHIGVIFLGNYGNDMLVLPDKHKIHTSVLCNELKSKNFKRCFRCRNRAMNKAIKTKEDFGDICINGIYEYIRPVIINNDVACIIFIGNIYNKTKGYLRLKSHIGNRDWLWDTMERNFNEYQCREMGELLESYIRMLLENYTKTPERKRVIDNIKNYIDDNLEFDIKISHIADFFFYNEQYLGRLFKKETGKSFSEYVNLRRLKKAQHLLTSSNNSILDIASSVGFNNVTYFNRIFKRQYGITPSEFRCNKT